MKKSLINICLTISLLFGLIPFSSALASSEGNVEIQIGDYLQMGVYNEKKIIWRCVDIDENGPLMLSDKIISLKSFDANGDVATGSHRSLYRKRYGSNYWADSNIRSWLNSNELAGNVTWLCGNSPDIDHTNSGYNVYSNEAGFLTNFSSFELNNIKAVSQDSILDAGDYSNLYLYGINYHLLDTSIESVVQNAKTTAYKEQITDKMFLLDVNQINKVWQNDSLLGGDNYYIGYPTANAVDKSGYKSKKLNADYTWTTWLRTPKSNSDGRYVRYVSADGMVLYNPAYFANVGIRPAFYLSSSKIFAEGSGDVDEPYILSTYNVKNSKDDNTYRFEISLSALKSYDDAEIVLAGYIGDALSVVEYKHLSAENKIALFDINNLGIDTFKVMVLESLETLKPLEDPYVISSSYIKKSSDSDINLFSLEVGEEEGQQFYLEDSQTMDVVSFNINDFPNWD